MRITVKIDDDCAMRRCVAVAYILAAGIILCGFQQGAPPERGKSEQKSTHIDQGNPDRHKEANINASAGQTPSDATNRHPDGNNGDKNQYVYIATTPEKPVDPVERVISIIGVVCTMALAIVGIVGICIALNTIREMKSQRMAMLGQWRAMRRQAMEMGSQTEILKSSVAAAQKSADAAKISADIAASVSIPTLVVEKFDVGETGAANLEAFLQYPQISITVKNCGQTPAFLKWWTIIFTCEDLPDIPIYEGKPGCGIILDKVIVEPSTSYPLPSLFYPHRQQLAIENVKAVVDRHKMLSVYGYICYGDLFGSPLRRLKFCETALNLFDGPKPTIGWADFGDPAYTGTDQFSVKKSAPGRGVEGQPSSRPW